MLSKFIFLSITQIIRWLALQVSRGEVHDIQRSIGAELMPFYRLELVQPHTNLT